MLKINTRKRDVFRCGLKTLPESMVNINFRRFVFKECTLWRAEDW